MNDQTKALLADAHNIAREQLGAAWQLHIDRLRELLGARWPFEIEQIFEERMAALAARLEEQYRTSAEARVSEVVAESRDCAERELAERLNQAARHLRGFEGERGWNDRLVEAAQGFCDRAAIFTLNGGSMHLEAARNIAGAGEVLDVPLDSAPAFASAVMSEDTVVAMRTSGEMSERLARWIGEAATRKFYVFPIASRGRTVALLYADADDRNVASDALELLALVAGALIETRAAAAAPPSELVTIAVPDQKPAGSSWASLDRNEEDLHLRAQRFARVQVAEIRLYKSENVKNGRTGRNLYTSLKAEIDSARNIFRSDFVAASGSMVDYLHRELVRTLANDDAELLGPDYPGPLV